VGGRTTRYRERLRSLDDWEPFLRDHSGLPGPRANLELAAAVAEEGDADRLLRLAAADDEFLVLCGAFGLGRLLGDGRLEHLVLLRALASDERWRVREGVVLGLQRWGDDDFDGLARELRRWIAGSALEQRAAVAAVCEPRLLREPGRTHVALDLLDVATRSLLESRDRTLRQALGYCWSVAIAADPEKGLPRFERWGASDDRDVRWIMRENEKKARLRRLRT
jgi:hypothetical protein